MPILSFVNAKGGVGKSSSAVHLALLLESRWGSDRVLFCDADAQESSSRWLERRQSQLDYIVATDPDRVLDSLPKLAQQAPYVVVDAPAGLAETTRAILLRSDLAACPCQPTDLDSDATETTLHLIEQAQSVRGGKPHPLLFLNKAQRNTYSKQTALEWMRRSEFSHSKSAIHYRQVFSRLYGQGASVWDLSSKPARQAAAEFEVLFDEMLEAIDAKAIA